MVGDGSSYWTRRSVSRRSVVRGAGVGIAGLAGAALIGCGGGGDGGPGTQATVAAGDITARTATPKAAAAAATAVPKEMVRLKPGLYEGQMAPSPAEANHAVNAKRGGTLLMRYLDPPRMDYNRTLSCTIDHTLNYTNNKLVRGRVGATAPLYAVEVEPDIAQSWEAQDKGAQFTFKLHQGVKTHNVAPVNGREFTSEDVVAAFDMYRKGGTQVDVFRPVTAIQAPDKYTVVIKLDQPLADFPINIASWSYIYLKELATDDKLRQEVAIGTGPFIQKEWVKKERSTFERHPDYFEKGLPYVDKIVTAVQDDVNALRAGFQTDNFFDWGPRDDADAQDMFKSKGSTMVYTKYPRSRGANVNGFQLQMKNPTFQDDRVRRALSLAFDRKEYDEARNAGDNRNPEGPYSNAPIPWPFMYDKYPTAKVNGPWYQYDPKQASQLMQAAGFTKEKPLQFTLQSFYYRQELSEVVIPGITRNLPEVKIGWKQIDNPTHVTLMSDRNFPEAIGFLWGPPGYSFDQWVYPFYHSKGGNNYGSVNDPDLDKLLDGQRGATDLAAKKQIWKQIWDRIHDKVYQAWFPEPLMRTAWHNYMLNYRWHGLIGSYTCYAGHQASTIWLDDGAPGVRR
ncbi:MAG: ABC transporter substrate-binding protein [Chloroflexi bacterium]|nr:ABC transporter substrate-binding protein [Chloroflexota bacterium]